MDPQMEHTHTHTLANENREVRWSDRQMNVWSDRLL